MSSCWSFPIFGSHIVSSDRAFILCLLIPLLKPYEALFGLGSTRVNGFKGLAVPRGAVTGLSTVAVVAETAETAGELGEMAAAVAGKVHMVVAAMASEANLKALCTIAMLPLSGSPGMLALW